MIERSALQTNQFVFNKVNFIKHNCFYQYPKQLKAALGFGAVTLKVRLPAD